jgi:putative phage-type endonuclease
VRIIRGIDQGTEEWHALRAGMPTASNFGKILAKGQGKTRRAYMIALLAERLTGTPVDSYSNAAMEWGTQTEPQARAVFELIHGVEVEQVTMVLRDDGLVGASPDGLIPGSGLEIKCPTTPVHIETVLSGEMPSSHAPQVQGCIWLAEVDTWQFMSFDPRVPGHSREFVVAVARDDKFIAALSDEVDRFIEEMDALECRLRGDIDELHGGAD